MYGVARISVVGGDTEARHAATGQDVEWMPSMSAAVSKADDATLLWIVTEGAEPRPDALGWLVASAERLDASVVGSKVLDIANPDHLLSSGLATDVFETPYTGFDADERDQGQYDVVRDVAAVGGQSVLVRKDLARGLGGPDVSMPPLAASIDFCQRARLRGGRVVVAPSSEVLAPDSGGGSDRWTDRAARIRSMIKVYGPLTLLWALPMAFLSGFVQSFLSLFMGRWRFFHWIRAWLWNLVKLPNTLAERRAARKGRVVGDSELFRYQVSGSVALKAVIGELSDRIRERLPGEDRLSVDAIGEEMRRPAFIVGAVSILFILIATRSIWAVGLPAVGFSLPFSESGPAAISAYAGGWNPAGLGSIEPLRPIIGFAGAIQTVLFDNRRLAEYVLTAGSWGLGVWGTVRLLRTWGIGAVGGTLAGVVYVAGPAAQAVAGETAVGVTFAIGIIPWVLRFAVAPFPSSVFARVGRLAAVATLTGIAGVLAPLTLVVPAAALLIWALFNLTDGGAWRAFAVSLIGAVFAVPMLVPWIDTADLGKFVTDGDAFWTVPVVTGTVAAVAALTVVVAAPRSLALVGGWGAILAVIGAFAARSASFGSGREVEAVGLAAMSLGLALVVGSSFESITRSGEIGGWRRLVAGVSVAASVFIVATAAVTLVGGRAGYPGDEFRDAFVFSEARPGDPSASRILVVGGPGDLPGNDRIIDGAAYRLVSAPMPESWETYLAEERIGDEAFADALSTIIAGETTRAGELLASFGVRWIVIIPEDEMDSYARAWVAAFDGQLDLVPLGGGLGHSTFENEAEHAVRALSTAGTEWTRAGTGYEGAKEFDEVLEVRENANDRWGPGEWRQIDWASGVTAAAGWAGFDPIESRRTEAIAAFVWLVALGTLSWAGRRFG